MLGREGEEVQRSGKGGVSETMTGVRGREVETTTDAPMMGVRDVSFFLRVYLHVWCVCVKGTLKWRERRAEKRWDGMPSPGPGPGPGQVALPVG